MKRGWLPAFGAALPMAVLFVTALAVVLTAAERMQLSASRTSSWILMLYGLPTIMAMVISARYRQPLFLTGNIFAIIFFASLADEYGYEELAGAALLAGALVLAAGALGVTGRVSRFLPTPIVMALVAGAVLPYVVRIFDALGAEAELAGGALVAYALSQLVFGTRVPPALPALVAGLVIAAATDALGDAPSSVSWPSFELIAPAFSWRSVLAATPVLVVITTVQSNIPSYALLRSNGFAPPTRLVDTVSGVGTVAGSFMGAVAVSLAVPLVSISAGEMAGPAPRRYRSVLVAGVAMLGIALFADSATELTEFVPGPLLVTVAGLALLPVLVSSLRAATSSALQLGPVVTFAVAVSDLSLLDLGPYFWSLVFGCTASLLLEREQWGALRAVP